jgi:hypothetical protein
MRKTLFIMYYYGDGYAAGNQNRRLIDSIASKELDYNVICRYSSISDKAYIKKISTSKCWILNGILYKIFPGLNSVTSFDELFWIIKVLVYLRKKSKKYYYIHIVSSPFFIQLIGHFINTRKQTKWIVQLLDPITDNSYIKPSKLGSFCLNRIERFVARNSDLILFNNDRLLNRFKVRYPNLKDKFRLLLLITDSIIVSDNQKNEKITLFHGGSLYGLRKIDFLIAALNKLKIITDKIRLIEIHFLGNFPQHDRDLVMQNDLEKIVLFHKYMPFEQMSVLLGKADALIIIDALESEGIFTPSKLCEYFSFEKPIFAITPKESVTSDFLSGTGHLCFNEGEEDQLAVELSNLIKDRNYFDGKFNKHLYENHLPNRIAEKYIEMLAKI